MKPSTATTIKPEILTLLSSARCDGSVALKHEAQLSRSEYQAYNSVLEALGGKWSRKHKGHVFDGDAQAIINAALDSGSYVDAKRAYELFETPESLADLIVERSGVEPFQKALEPSAGNGRIVSALITAGALVTAVEVNDAHAEKLRSLTTHVTIADFLTVEPEPIYNAVVMNPPFSNGQDTEHVRHAYEFLVPGGKLVAVMSPHWTFAQDKKAVEFKNWADDLGACWTNLPEGSFKQSGTNVRTVLFEVWKEGE